jgi:hypothetical protein
MMARAVRVVVTNICDIANCGNCSKRIALSSDELAFVDVCKPAAKRLGIARPGIYKVQFTRDKAIVGNK